MRFPKNKVETIKIALKYREWLVSGGEYEKFPKELDDAESNSVLVLCAGMFLHTIMYYVSRLAFKLNMWNAVGFLARIRISTDRLSVDVRACGYNLAYTHLGISKLKRNDVNGAIYCLAQSALVLPCCHNTSFGLCKRLANELENVPEAKLTVKEYWEIYNAFLA